HAKNAKLWSLQVNLTCDVPAESPVGGLGTFSHKLLDSAKLNQTNILLHSDCMGCLLSHEMCTSRGRRLCRKSNATCAMPLVRGVVALPGSKNTSRAKGMYRKLGDPASDHDPDKDVRGRFRISRAELDNGKR